MEWRAYEVVLRLRAPMHIGCGKVGNLLRTRGYVPGRVLWGAFTLRLTRQPPGARMDSRNYQIMGDNINQSLAFTYFYPALQQGGSFSPCWPWAEDFPCRFLGSYASTALSYPQQTAEEGALHEVEFLSPYTHDTGEPVYLMGYIAAREDAPDWQALLGQIQLGAERCYGWGRVTPACAPRQIEDGAAIFGNAAKIEYAELTRPRVCLEANQTILAHTPLTDLQAAGRVEPFVGREWRSHNPTHCYAGQHVEFIGVCFQPGSKLLQNQKFEIGPFGMWIAIQ